MESQVKKSAQKPQPRLQKIPAIWLALGMLLLAFFLPLGGELLQRLLIGEEEVCCMPDNLDFLLARAEIAQFLRPLSNLIIGGTMLAGAMLAVYTVAYFYRHYHGKQQTKVILTAILGLIAAYIVATLITMLIFFILRNDLYFQYRPWPGGSLYDDAWYDPAHWWRATFTNPFA